MHSSPTTFREPTRTGTHALVLGAGMGGLAAAKVLSNHFNQVTVLERDALDDSFNTRRGVPQGGHAHALLAKGLERYEAMFPGLTGDLEAAGAVIGDASNSMHWSQLGHLHARRPTGIVASLSTRGFLETIVRRRLAGFPNVQIRDEATVSGLTWNIDGTRVTGIHATPAGGGTITLLADLVVDATGRGSKLPGWLEEAGFPAPAEESVPAQSRYATRHFRAPADLFGETRIFIDVASPARPTGGLATVQENGLWTVMLIGRAGITPPVDMAGFTSFAHSLKLPEIAAVIERGEPVDDGQRYHFPASIRRRYDLTERFPHGLLPFADSISGFNPVYGQGMTVAALEADILDRYLERGTIGLFRRFMDGASPVIDAAWKLACSGDLPYFMDAAAMPRSMRFITWYMSQVHQAAERDAEVAVAFAKVVHLMAPASSMLAPRIVARVARENLRQALTGQPIVAPVAVPIEVGRHSA
jgi:2-polyprenyl-6-methoxyphenol hydroxylase-like FAD-dependent oxidoreductase